MFGLLLACQQEGGVTLVTCEGKREGKGKRGFGYELVLVQQEEILKVSQHA